MKLEDIIAEWQIDAHLDEQSLDREALKISELQHKYLAMLLVERPILKTLQLERKRMRGELHSYFRGELNNPEDLKAIGRPPCTLRIKYQNMDEHIDQDPAFIKLNMSIIKAEEKVAALEEIMQALKSRGFHISAANKFIELKSGF